MRVIRLNPRALNVRQCRSRRFFIYDELLGSLQVRGLGLMEEEDVKVVQKLCELPVDVQQGLAVALQGLDKLRLAAC